VYLSQRLLYYTQYHSHIYIEYGIIELYRTASARTNVRPARASCSATTAAAVGPANDPRSVCGTVSAWRFPTRVIYLRIVHNIIIIIIYIYIYYVCMYSRLWVYMIYHFLFIIFYYFYFYITSLYTRTHTPVFRHIIMYIYTLSRSLRLSLSACLLIAYAVCLIIVVAVIISAPIDIYYGYIYLCILLRTAL